MREVGKLVSYFGLRWSVIVYRGNHGSSVWWKGLAGTRLLGRGHNRFHNRRPTWQVFLDLGAELLGRRTFGIKPVGLKQLLDIRQLKYRNKFTV